MTWIDCRYTDYWGPTLEVMILRLDAGGGLIAYPWYFRGILHLKAAARLWN